MYCSPAGCASSIFTSFCAFSDAYCSKVGCSTMSTSPATSALNCVCGSRMITHSTRSTFTTLPPVVPLGSSARGRYFSLRRYTTRSPGLNSAGTKRNGPEPTCSLICSVPGVAAMRAGITNGTFDEGLPSASSITPKGVLSLIANALGPWTCHASTERASTCPKLSRVLQRLSEATTSSAVTGAPSWNSRPSRREKVHSRLSFETDHLSTICGRTRPSRSVPKRVS